MVPHTAERRYIMANIIRVEKVAITTKKGVALDTIRVYTDKKVNAEQKKFFDKYGFKPYSEIVDNKMVWYYGVDASKAPKNTFDLLSKKIAKPEEPKLDKAELEKKLKGMKKADIIAMLLAQ